MYVPSAFAETRTDVLQAFIRQHAFATIVSVGAASGAPEASHVPVVLRADRGRLGTLQFHLAKPNAHGDVLAHGSEVLALFHGPHGYISPTWYATSAPAVPTWNYAVVHARGTPHAMTDDAELEAHLRELVAAFEAGNA